MSRSASRNRSSPPGAASPAPSSRSGSAWRQAPARTSRDPRLNPERVEARLSEAGIRQRLAALAPAYRQRLVEEAGGEEALARQLATTGSKLAFQRLMPDTAEDLFVYDRIGMTVLELPGLNTAANEVVPAPALFDRYVIYNADEGGTWDVYVYDQKTRMIDTVPDVRTGADELFPTLSLNGRWMSCVERTPAGPRLRLYDRKEGRWLVPAIEADTECRTPFMSPLGGRVIFATPVDGQLDLRVYDVLLHRDITPPYLNSAGDEALASFSLDGTQLVFSSNRRGAPGLYLADLDTGVVQPLVLTDAPAGRQYAYFIGLDEIAVVSTRTGELGCFAYRLDTQVLDTLPFCGKGLPGGPPGIVAAELLPAKGEDLVEVLSAGGAGQDPEAHPAAPSDAARQEAPEPTFGLREAGDVSTPVAGRPGPESILVCP